MVSVRAARRNPKKRRRRLAALGKYVLGYETTAAPGVKRYGPQPYEALLSEVCDAFGVDIFTAERTIRERYAELMGILDYRNLRAAIRLMNEQTESAAAALAAQPELQALVKEVLDLMDEGE